MKNNTLRNWFYATKCFVRETSSNIIASVIASLVITFSLGKSTIDSAIKIKPIIIIELIGSFLIISIIIFVLLKYLKKKKYKPIKAIVFDFDGTLSKCNIPDIHSPWELLWKETGHRLQDCHGLYQRFEQKEISHQEWCDLTCEKFKNGKLNISTLKKISSDFELYQDVRKVLDKFKVQGLKLYLVSGSIKQLIDMVWGNDIDNYFDRVNANIFRFKDKQLVQIVGTKYDFEGKAQFINEVILNEKFNNPREILFIGNSNNDKSAYKSGAQTLCINPLETDPTNKRIWHDSIKVECYSDLYDFIQKEYIKC